MGIGQEGKLGRARLAATSLCCLLQAHGHARTPLPLGSPGLLSFTASCLPPHGACIWFSLRTMTADLRVWGGGSDEQPLFISSLTEEQPAMGEGEWDGRGAGKAWLCSCPAAE